MLLLDGIGQQVQMGMLFRREQVDSQTQLLESLLPNLESLEPEVKKAVVKIGPYSTL